MRTLCWRKSLGAVVFIAIFLIARLHAQTPPGDPPPSYTELGRWSFNDESWESDNGVKALSYTNVQNVAGGDNNTLLVDTTNMIAAFLKYPVIDQENGATNLTVNQGSVVFWFAPNWSSTNMGGTGPGDWGRLLEVGQFTTNASVGWWGLYFGPEGTNIYFAAQTNGGSFTPYLNAPIAWTNNGWHQIGLTYSATNTSLYLDGLLATNGPGVTVWPGIDAITNGFIIGSESSGLAQARGRFDDMLTYDAQVEAGFIGTYFSLYSIVYFGYPVSYSQLGSAPSQPSNGPVFLAITGGGNLTTLSNTPTCVTAGNVWLTNITSSMTGDKKANVTFAIQGGSDGLNYDVFATSVLESSSTNFGWAWVGQGTHCKFYSLTNLPNGSTFLILGTPLDSDNDGLTDAYEKLVSKTDPYITDTSGDGMLDGWKAVWGLDMLANNPEQSSKRANYGYQASGWLETITGLLSGSIGLDNEGNVQSSAQ